MRRTLAISLLVLFALPFTLPLFGANAAAETVPVCCRRNGKHHCVMSMASRAPRTRTVGTRCPYRIIQPAILVLPSYTPSAPASIFAGLLRHPAVVAQVEARQRVSLDLSRQKRGPPPAQLL